MEKLALLLLNINKQILLVKIILENQKLKNLGPLLFSMFCKFSHNSL